MHPASIFAATVLAAGSLLAQEQVIVHFKAGIDLAALGREGVAPTATVWGTDAVVVRATGREIQRLRRLPEVAFVEEDAVAGIAAKGGKPGGGDPPPQQTPWGVLRVRGASAPSAGNVKIAIVDTGIDLDHADLAANIVGDANFVRAGNPGDDDNGHGTHVGGTVAAVDNTIGVVGVAPDAKLLAVKVLDRRGSGSHSGIASGINWAVANGANIINMSLGGSGTTSTLKNACDNALAANVLLVAAAGNEGDCDFGTNECSYPAHYDSVISVGATNIDDALYCFSNTCPSVELSGPGGPILSTYKGNGYREEYGTSMASPHAAGVAALIWATNPNAGSVRNALISRAADRGPTGRDNGWGYGVVQF